MRGLVQKQSGGGASQIALLPAGWRPPINLIFTVPMSVPTYGDITCHLYVGASGEVRADSFLTSGSGVGTIGSANVVTWLSLAPIRFFVA